MIVINDNLCDELYLNSINNFVFENKNNFICENDPKYFLVFDNKKNINNSFLHYNNVETHINFLKTKFSSYFKHINSKDYVIECVVNKLIKNCKINIHNDGTLYTHILYLNDEYTGGELLILGNKKTNKDKRQIVLTIQPEKNLSILFSENHFHKVNPILDGERYTLTTFIRKKEGYTSHHIQSIL
jgi:Rps23 Pro-64 3,4-dihydroxylase Tpa1-like proline 4-hydroxylase